MGYFSSSNAAIEEVRFASGVTWDSAAGNSSVISGTAQTLTGTLADDLFVVSDVCCIGCQ